jgi:hypothetical protein
VSRDLVTEYYRLNPKTQATLQNDAQKAFLESWKLVNKDRYNTKRSLEDNSQTAWTLLGSKEKEAFYVFRAFELRLLPSSSSSSSLPSKK